MIWGIVINNNYMGRPHHCGHNNLFNMMMTYNLFQGFMNSLFPPKPIQQTQPVWGMPAMPIMPVMPAIQSQSVFTMPVQQQNPFVQSYNTNIQPFNQNFGSATYQNLIESDYFQNLLKSQPTQNFYPNFNLSNYYQLYTNFNANKTKTDIEALQAKSDVDFSSDKTKVNSRYSGTAEDLNKKLANRGVLAGKGAVFLKAQEEYGVNAAFLASICIHESGGTSNYAKNKNNVGGIRIPGKTEFRTFNSVDECIMYMANFLKNGYIDKGLTTIAKVGAKYCPTADPTDKAGKNGTWAGYVSKIYNSFA